MKELNGPINNISEKLFAKMNHVIYLGLAMLGLVPRRKIQK
ncbi:MAG: hypothetical protein ABIO02_04005 [Patescibacteria group bacterium]